MPRRATSTSFGRERGNKAGDPVKAGKASADPRIIRMRQREMYAREMRKVDDALQSGDAARVQWAMEHLAKYGLGTQQAVDHTTGGEQLKPGVIYMPAPDPAT